MRMHVKPADPSATIRDPDRNRDLTPEGHPVAWTPYWATLKARGDIIATPTPDPEADAATPAPAAEPEASEAHEPDPAA